MVMEKVVQALGSDRLSRVDAESGLEAVRRSALLEGQQADAERVMHTFEQEALVREPVQRFDPRLLKEHLPQLLGAEIGVDPRWPQDAAPPTFSQQVEALLEEKLV